MSEAADQKMKALVETETETVTSSSVKNDVNQEKAVVIIKNLCDNKNVNLGLSLGGLYGQTSGATPLERVVVEVGQRPSSHQIHNITTDNNNLFFQIQHAGHEVLPERRLLIRPQFVPVRRLPARSNLRQARAIAQRKLPRILPSNLNRGIVALRPANGGPDAEMTMFQHIPGTSTNWNQRPAVPAGIKFHNSLASHSYVEPIPAGVELHNGPAPVLSGTTELIQNASGSGPNVEFGGKNFQNAATGLDSNGESVEFIGTNIENAPIGFGSNGPLTEYVGTMVPNDGASDSSKVENERGGSSANEKTLEEIVAAAAEEENRMENREAKRVKLSNEGYGEYGRKVLKKLPSVMSKNGRRIIHGFLYKYKKGDVSMVCNCHGYFLNPNQFLKHAGATDLSDPMKNIIVAPFDI